MTPRLLRAPHARRGIAALYVVITLVALVGFTALGIDVGRVFLARTELQGGADSAARAAVQLVPKLQFATGRATAGLVAGWNTALADNIVLDTTNDVEFGLWDWRTRTFTKYTAATDLPKANAVRVTARRESGQMAGIKPVDMHFAQVVGWKTMNVNRQGIAMISGGTTEAGHGLGFVGLDWIRTVGTINTNAWDPITKLFGQGGSIASNGNIRINGQVTIDGDVRQGIDDILDIRGGSYSITGYRGPLTQDMSFAALPAPSSYNNASIASFFDSRGNVRISSDVAINGGTDASPLVLWVPGSFTINGNNKLILSGTVQLYVGGDFNGGGGSIVSPGQIASLDVISVNANTSVTVGGTPDARLHIYAPLSDVNISGVPDFYGSIIGKTLTLNGTSALHYDGGNLKYQPDDKFKVTLVK